MIRLDAKVALRNPQVYGFKLQKGIVLTGEKNSLCRSTRDADLRIWVLCRELSAERECGVWYDVAYDETGILGLLVLL